MNALICLACLYERNYHPLYSDSSYKLKLGPASSYHNLFSVEPYTHAIINHLRFVFIAQLKNNSPNDPKQIAT